MPASRWPPKGSGGKVMGTRRMELKTPLSPRIFQNGSLPLRLRMRGFDRGRRYRPSFRLRRGGITLAEESTGP